MARGCGTREAGGIYLTVATGPDGLPLNVFLYCPAIPVSNDFDLPNIGMVEIDWNGRQGMLDHVGNTHYPNVLDFLAEGAKMGFSRHITADIASKLTPGALLLPVHDRALILNWSMYPGRTEPCPHAYRGKHVVELGSTDREMDWFYEEYPEYANGADLVHQLFGCSGYWREDVEGGDVDMFRETVRTVGDTTYRSKARPEGMEYMYHRGIIAALPIGGIEIIDGSEETARNYERLKGLAKLPLMVVPE